MQNELAIYDHPLGLDSLVVRNVWHVDADPTYDVRTHPSKAAMLIVVRTLDGLGRVTFGNGVEADLPGGTLLLFRYGDARRYRCAAARWHFWWLECEGAGESLPLRTVLPCAVSAAERSEYEECFRVLGRGSPDERSLASLRLRLRIARLVHDHRRATPPARTPQEMGSQAIARMQDNLGGAAIAQIAEDAYLGPRRFRQVFRQVTGQSPKRYYNSLRLEHAAQLLLSTPLSVTQVADRLGFSSAFHLSRAFRGRYGVPPSEYRAGAGL